MSSSFSKSCKYCGVGISLKESSPGRWEAFGRGGKPHVCKKASAPKSVSKTRSKTESFPEPSANGSPKRSPKTAGKRRTRRSARKPRASGNVNSLRFYEWFWGLSIGRRVLLTLVVSMLLWSIWSQFNAGSDRTGDFNRNEARINATKVRPE
jgi:hypothetical protein